MLRKFKVKKDFETSGVNNLYSSLVPAGLIVAYHSTTPPDGWLLCNGASYAKSLYPNLDSVLSGVSYPFGSTTTNFNVPDFTNRIPIGTGTGSGLTTRQLADTGGSNTVTMVEANMPAHQHGLNNHTHNSNTVNTDGAHTHTMNAANSGGINAPLGNHTHSRPNHAHGWYFSAIAGGGTSISTMRASGTTQNAGIAAGNNASSGVVLADTIFGSYYHLHSVSPTTGNQSANHTHNITTDPNTVVATGGTFTPTAVNVENPYLTVAFIIKF